MTKQEFFDKVDSIRNMVDGIGDSFNAGVEDIILLLDEVKNDAEQLLDDECDTAYQLGLNRGWNHEDGGDF